MMTPDLLDELASELWRAEQSGGAVELPSSRFPGFSWDDARRVARAVDELRLAGGHRLIGYKLGWTSAVMREALGIDRPNWGTLWDHQQVDGVIDVSTLRHPKVEPELVYRAGRDLFGPDVDRETVLETADGWALGHEIVHPRFPDFGFTWLDNTADNSSSQAIVVGSFETIDGDPADVEIDFGSGHASRSGRGDAAMGSPAEAVAWLVRSLHGEGTGLRAGDIVFTGGLAKPFDLQPGDHYHLRAMGLDDVNFEVTAR
ncbi:MAG: hypothetical protein OEW83_10820 [Acidimicrobiia bacterium]|nr:hypothetical protein [Acidimicrobiia bacterium]